MFRDKSRRCDDRIVSISVSPMCDPIVRGEQSKPVEFGANLSVSAERCWDWHAWIIFDGMRFMRLTRSASAGRGLPPTGYGYYPQKVLADPIYGGGTHANRRYLKSKLSSFLPLKLHWVAQTKSPGREPVFEESAAVKSTTINIVKTTGNGYAD